MKEISFGYWPRNIELHAGGATIRPVGSFDRVVKSMEQNNRVTNGWLYPPLVIERDQSNSLSSRTTVYKRVFGVDSTHCLCLPRTSNARMLGEFLIALLGMLEGLRLIPEGWVHFYRAAVKPNTLSDVCCGARDLERVLTIGQKFWTAHDTVVRGLMFGAIHWRVFSESYEHEFERFSGQYTVLDTCWNIFERLEPGWISKYQKLSNASKCAVSINPKPKYVPHGARPSVLAKRYKLRIPLWARTRNGRPCRLAELRNKLVHEGQYGEKPIGFGYPKNFSGSIDLEVASFNTRLILAMIGVKSQYLRSSVHKRSQFPMGF